MEQLVLEWAVKQVLEDVMEAIRGRLHQLLKAEIMALEVAAVHNLIVPTTGDVEEIQLYA